MRVLEPTSSSIMHTWKSAPCPSIGPDTLERISYILGIYKGINMLLPEDRANDWVRAPNAAPAFGGKGTLEVMSTGDITDLANVRQYIDAQRV